MPPCVSLFIDLLPFLTLRTYPRRWVSEFTLVGDEAWVNRLFVEIGVEWERDRGPGVESRVIVGLCGGCSRKGRDLRSDCRGLVGVSLCARCSKSGPDVRPELPGLGCVSLSARC